MNTTASTDRAPAPATGRQEPVTCPGSAIAIRCLANRPVSNQCSVRRPVRNCRGKSGTLMLCPCHSPAYHLWNRRPGTHGHDPGVPSRHTHWTRPTKIPCPSACCWPLLTALARRLRKRRHPADPGRPHRGRIPATSSAGHPGTGQGRGPGRPRQPAMPSSIPWPPPGATAPWPKPWPALPATRSAPKPSRSSAAPGPRGRTGLACWSRPARTGWHLPLPDPPPPTRAGPGRRRR